ncbi:hypothetical protein [Thiothrix nivea]|uniref:Uncharacterized protein n=1 Tax=Thiothrix nivea (strain ATCC 35100 / DSM 5205 / JP2) TaxID=870187 RepID=A0A656HDR9_THINJ|nr:hypothetical protein [Thiothrix nivea]EIJ33329.1 hypothetical protein Thini_0692 [Thiothrix nivea DSM 5205]
MNQHFGKVGAVANLSGRVNVVKILVVNRIIAVNRTIPHLTLVQWLSLAGLVGFGFISGIKAFVL